MMKISTSIITLFIVSYSLATVDLTFPELQHLANHMTKEECNKLMAALHFNSFNLIQDIENAENMIPEEVSCLKLLCHWNASPGEGLGGTHERVSLRLRQIGRHDLAAWLDSAVLRELRQEMDKELGTTAMSTTDDPGSYLQDQFVTDEDESFLDYLQVVGSVFIVIVSGTVVFYICTLLVKRYRLSKIDPQKEKEIREIEKDLQKRLSQY